MKSKKLMGLLLAGTIMVGATAYGSYAYFTDSVATKANLTISMGNLDIALDELPADEQWWVKEGSETDEEVGGWNPNNYFSNVRPGDVFTRTIPVVNEGSLTAKCSIALAEGINEVALGNTGLTFGDVFEIVATGTGDVEIAKGETANVSLELKVKEDLGNDLNANNGSTKLYKFNLNQLLKETGFVTVEATQTNAN